MAKRNKLVAKLRKHIQSAYELAEQLELGNIFYNEGFAEFFLAQDLGHTWNTKTQGPDGFDPIGHPVEYKMRSANDVSFQFHWLSDEKIARLSETEFVYFATRNQTEFTGIYCIKMKDLMPSLLENRKTDRSGGHRSYSLNTLIELGAYLVG